MLARDARRLADAQRCRPGPPPSRARLVRAATAGVLDRALDVAAALEVRGYGAARRAPREPGSDRPGRDTTWPSPPRRWRSWRSPSAAGSPGSRRSAPTRSCARRCARAAWPWRLGCWCARCSRSPTAGGSSDERARAATTSPTRYPGAAAPALDGRHARGRAGRAGRAGRRVGLGKVHAAARRQRAGAALPRRGVRRSRSRGRAWTRASTAPARWPRRSARCSRIPRRRS